MTSSTGWISLHRQIQDHWLWTDKPFSKQAAWIDMLLLANHADNKFLFGNELIEVKSGSFITSELKLMERWGWGKTKTRSFLELLQSDGMIVKKSDRKRTAITIVKYSDFQGLQTTNKPLANHKQTTGRPSADTNNNDNNDNNDNNENKYFIIVEFLNQKAGTKYKASSKKTKTCIHARLSEGFTIDDFKTVIEKKCAEWLGNPKMEQYLRPETLFGTKFESYLNAKVTPNQTNNRTNAEPPKNSTDEFMNKLQSLYEKDDE